MEADSGSPQSENQKAAENLYALVSGPLASSVTQLSNHSRGIPFDKDFHFYNNFDQFRAPAREVAEKSESLLSSIGSSALLRRKQHHPSSALPGDLDDAYDWLVNLNDDFLERFGASMDEFKNLRVKEEGNGGNVGSLGLEDGFQMVYGKRKKKELASASYNHASEERQLERNSSSVKVASRDKKTMIPRSRVPFHIPTIPRPQDEFSILVNNSNQPFEHVWLERSEDDSRFIHPLEKLSVYDFVDKSKAEDEPVKPLPIENCPFKFVEGVNELKELAAKLRNVNEFAVDLEHNHYRSFQGLTCLMQISTRTEDFVVDTLKLRIHVGPHLREIFKDPSKRKVMHGADRDILWLQRDFGIYVCNLFDTGQASRVLQLERNSLEYLLQHFCGVTANKEYQNADWRLRPLPDEMIKYAREDTHYLLYMYDLMRCRLLSASSDSENSDAHLIEVYKRSYEICMQLYEKELLSATSYLYIYGLHEADFNSQQLAVVAGLCEWRDNVARAEDESTGYILPNKTLLEIARQIPLSSAKLRRLVKSRHPFVERYLNAVVAIIRSSVENSGAFEGVVEQLKKEWVEKAPDLTTDLAGNIPEFLPAIEGATSHGTAVSQQTVDSISPVKLGLTYDDLRTATNGHGNDKALFISQSWQNEKLPPTTPSEIENGRGTRLTASAAEMDYGSSQLTQKPVGIASVQMSKKPSGAFGALLGNSSSKRKFHPDPKDKSAGQDNIEVKVEHNSSSVTLPFHSFSGGDIAIKHPPEPIKSEHPESLRCQVNEPARTTELEEVIPLNTNESEDSDSPSRGSPTAEDDSNRRDSSPQLPENGLTGGFASETNVKEEPVSLSDLSSSFQKCFQSVNESRSSHQNPRAPPEGQHNSFQFEPFDYAAARRHNIFGDGKEEAEADSGRSNSRGSREKRRGGLGFGRLQGEERGKDSQPPRRRQAFPPSGNRSATFR